MMHLSFTRHFKPWLGAFLGLSLLAVAMGCGGGGVRLGNQLRLLQPNDQWVYRETTSEIVTGEPTTMLHSEITFTVVDRTFQGQARRAFRVSDQEMTAQGVPLGSPIVYHIIFQQDPNTGQIVLLGEEDDGGELPFAQPRQFLPGTLVAGLNWQYADETLPDNPVTSLTVIGLETVTVPHGVHTAWRIDSTTQVGTQQTQSASLWVRPDIVSPVRMITNFDLDDPTVIATSEMVLVSTNFM